nr:unnamed protein product [Trypanosoma congolense IL3000]
MMTNVSADPSFKQHVVTLFEVGKLSEELMGSFIEKLEEVQDSKKKCTLFGEAAQYIQNVISLREVLKALRKVVGPDGERGVDMIKVESMNEQDPTTRYSLLGRNYWAYFVTSPVLQAPMIDVNISGVYGSTVGLMPSPWMMMFLYSKTRRGPPSLLLPLGTPILAWPEIFHEGNKRCVTKLRLQLLMVNTEVTYVDAATTIILANEMITTAPLFAQRVSDVPLEIPAVSAMVAAAAETVCENEGSEFDGAEAMKEIVTESPFHMSLTLTVPFTASDDDAIGLLRASILQQRQSATTVRFVGSQPLHTHNPTHHANNGDTALGESCELELSRSNLLDAAIDVPIAAGVVATEEAPPARYLECFHEAVAALQLQNSLGCFTFHISLYEVAVVPTNSGGVHFYRVDAASIVDMGLGFNLADQRCCDLMVQQLQDLLDEPRMEAHCTAMLRLSRELGEFLQCHSSLTTVEHEQMSLQSAAIAGPIAQQHVRRLGEKGNSGAPFPSEVLMFDGERLSAFEDWDPLVELWQA